MLKTLPHLALQLLILTEQRPGLKESMTQRTPVFD